MTTPVAPAKPASPAPAPPAAPAPGSVPAPTSGPVDRTPDSILGALRLTLVELNEAILGEAGTQVKTLKQRTGPVADVVRKGVALIAQLMTALAKGMEIAGNLILGADAVFALLEVVLDTLDAMIYAVGGTVAYLASEKDGGAPDLSALDTLRAPLAEAKAFLGENGLVAELLPAPHEISGIRRELAILVGSRADPKYATTGTLGALAAAIALPGAPAPAAPNAPAPAPAPANNSAAPNGPQGR